MARGVKVRMMMARSVECRGGSRNTNHAGARPVGGWTTELNVSWSSIARFTLA